MKLSLSTRAYVLVLILTVTAFTGFAQTPADNDRERAIQMVNEGKCTEALPILEKLAERIDDDGQIYLGLGICYWFTFEESDPAKDKAARLKARNALLKAKTLGASIPETDLIIARIGEDGRDRSRSENAEVNKLMDEALQLFAQQKYAEAVVPYEKAATLDPTLYDASLYTGNTYLAMKEHQKAGVWFAKAIAIEPNRETAHRYWADSLWKAGKNKEAVDKFIDAVIAEPHSTAAWRGIIQYSQANNIKLAHPKINIPVNVSEKDNGNINITLGDILGDKEDDGSGAWMAYGISKAAWRADKDGKPSEYFSKAYPNEKKYRESLAEELDAFEMVLSLATKDKKVKKLSPALASIKKLNDDGVLGAYILISRVTESMKTDYPKYRTDHKDKVRLYITNYIMKNGGF
ncbi:MAG: hypothetical protein KF685_07145 [Acidobacteria bacterium]|nr:hypothetical protein [Acidobacteriota bacterium]